MKTVVIEVTAETAQLVTFLLGVIAGRIERGHTTLFEDLPEGRIVMKLTETR